MIPIALVGDNRLAREGLASLLSPLPDVRLVAAVDSTATRILREVAPEVVLVDRDQDNPDGLLDVVGRVVVEAPDAKIIVIDVVPDEENLPDMIRAGVSGLTLEDARLEDLLNTIRSVARGARVLPSKVTGALFSQIVEERAPKPGPPSMDGRQLTPRQREVVDLLARGYSNKKIAAELHISSHTVKTHVRNIMKTLALDTRLKVAAWVHREAAE